MKTIYFQPKGIKPQYCEIGMILEMDPEYIQYLDEPCKIAISEVKIIDKENVTYNKKIGCIMLRPMLSNLADNGRVLYTDCLSTEK
jgi:hypothetical protein